MPDAHDLSQGASDRLSRIEAKTDSMAGDIRDIKADVHAVAESAFPRTEADQRSREWDRRMLDLTQAVASRLEITNYQVAHDALIQRVVRLETSPQRQVGWIAMAVSGGLGCLTLLVMLLGAAVSISALVVTLTR